MNRFRDPQTSGAYTPEYHQLFGSSTWITLKNVSPLLNEGDLVSIFSQFGVVVDVVIPRTAPHKAKENNILLTTAAGGEDLATQRGIKRSRDNNNHHSNDTAVELTLPQRNTLYFLEFELVGSAIAAADCMNSCPPIHTLPATQQKQLKALQAANVTARPPPPILRNSASSSSGGGGGGMDEPQHQQAIQSAHHNLAGPFRSLLLPGHDTVGLVVDRCTIKEVPVHDKMSSKAALVPLLSSSSSTAAGGGGGGGSGGGGQHVKPQPLPPHPIHGLGRRPTEPAAVYPSFPEWTLAQLAARQKKIRAAVATSQ